MGRIRTHIRINGQKRWTLFDTGARNTYIIRDAASSLLTLKLKKPIRTGLGGMVQTVKETAVLEALVEGQRITTHAFVVPQIGKDETGMPIEIILGALAMQQWGIRPVPDEERLDLTHYPTEFIEF
ncbi:MAG: aspartyl protease family protein [Planctomycetes bacterium]|nr:aspartyl protease family protein [Planctomycetota bacterium]